MCLFTVTILCCVTFALQPINSNMSLTHCSACIFFCVSTFFLCCFFLNLCNTFDLALYESHCSCEKNSSKQAIMQTPTYYKNSPKRSELHIPFISDIKKTFWSRTKKKNLITLALPNLSALVCKSFFFFKVSMCDAFSVEKMALILKYTDQSKRMTTAG